MASNRLISRGLQRFSRNRHILTFCLIVAFLYIFKSTYGGVKDPHFTPHSLKNRSFNASAVKPAKRKQPGCNVPEMTLQNSKINQFFQPSSPVICNKDKDWISVSNGRIVFSTQAQDSHGPFQCHIQEFTRFDEDNTRSAKKRRVENGSKLMQDFFFADCAAPSSGKNYKNIHAGVVPQREVLERRRKSGIPGYNIVMVGFDSVSRLTFMRKMKKTFAYLTNSLGAIILKRYNIVGDGTPQALIPMLTGHTEWELPETRQGKPNAQPCDVYPFIWKNLSKSGYVTLWAEDSPSIGTFTHRMLGFRQRPVDHYMRTFYIEAVNPSHRYSHYCLGSEHQTTVHFDYITHLFAAYPNTPKFAFAFSDLSHDEQQMLDTSDVPFHDWLKRFERSGYLNNTILITMSDHGSRFSHIRRTQDGKMEERNPFVSVVLPQTFVQQYPKAAANLGINQDRLATPFDIYATFTSILTGVDTSDANLKDRGISLFKEIPIERTCQNAEIEPHWCNCLVWSAVPIDDNMVTYIANMLLDAFNNETEEYRQYCLPLKLDYIMNASMFSPNKGLLNYHWAKDRDGRTPGFIEGYAKATRVTYQVTIVTKPGGNTYEASADYSVDTKAVRINLRNVGVLNRYGPNGFCIHDKDLVKERYCFCRSKLKSA